MMDISLEIRRAVLRDIPDIAHIHVKAWQQAYAGQIDQEYLDSLDVAARQKNWEQGFEKNPDTNVYMAFVDGTPVGFICYGNGRDETKAAYGEIYAVYLLQEVWKKGIGYALHQVAKEKLLADGFSKIYLWVLDTNENAIRAYQRWGGVLDMTAVKESAIGQQQVKEVAVVF